MVHYDKYRKRNMMRFQQPCLTNITHQTKPMSFRRHDCFIIL